MRILNLGCGGERPLAPPWTNLDDLHSQLEPGTGARKQLDAEPNYINFVVGSAPLPFDDNSLDGILASHFFEHWDAQQCVAIMRDCLRILKPMGEIMVSVPDASYFLKVYPEDRNSNWPRLFGVTDPRNPIPTFFEAALFFEQHKQVFTEDSLACCLLRSGYRSILRLNNEYPKATYRTEEPDTPFFRMIEKLNRLEFSLILHAIK